MIDAATPQTIAEFFARTVAARAKEPALGHIRNGELHWLTWQQVADAASSLTAEIQEAGVAPGDRVAHVSENRYEWIVTDLAMHLTGAIHVPIHVTLSGQQIADQITDSGAKLAFVSTNELLTKFADQVPRDVVIRLHEDWDGRLAALPGNPPSSALGVPQSETSLATLLYTSGTTGRPRGVMLSHTNLASNAASVCEIHQMQAEHTMLCILPLSHIYARTCDLYTWIVSGSQLVIGESRETLLRDCQLVRPTGLNAVPFVYQRLMDGVVNSGAADKAAALSATFGGRMERLCCGGAPVAPDVETWYADQGLPLLPGYGLTEASPVIAVTTLWSQRRGTVGHAIPGVEVRTAADGELLTRGPHVMVGYWHDETATAEAIDAEGWLHTGDLAQIDRDGFVTIRGRKKELIVLSTGKKVVPTRVESLLTASPLIDQAAVFGDGHTGLTALIVPAACDGESEERGARSERIATEIKRCLAAAAHEEQIHRFALVDRPFSIDRGELTAKMSLCRETIARNFAAELNANREPSTG